MYRTRKATLIYRPDETLDNIKMGVQKCPFCNFPKKQSVQEYKHFLVVSNRYGYQLWEFMDVTDHLMIVPKEHIGSISELTKAEKIELIDIMAEWEKKGYNLYAREENSAMKSVPHQHTHLIKTKNQKAKFGLYIRKPYLVIKK